MLYRGDAHRQTNACSHTEGRDTCTLRTLYTHPIYLYVCTYMCTYSGWVSRGMYVDKNTCYVYTINTQVHTLYIYSYIYIHTHTLHILLLFFCLYIYIYIHTYVYIYTIKYTVDSIYNIYDLQLQSIHTYTSQYLQIRYKQTHTILKHTLECTYCKYISPNNQMHTARFFPLIALYAVLSVVHFLYALCVSHTVPRHRCTHRGRLHGTNAPYTRTYRLHPHGHRQTDTVSVPLFLDTNSFKLFFILFFFYTHSVYLSL